MKTIKIIYAGKQEIHHDYFKPQICTSDIDLPKMYNQGYNSFRFEGGEPQFLTDFIPTELKRETNNYLFHEAQIKVFRTNETFVTGNYYKTTNKATGETKETFCFD